MLLNSEQIERLLAPVSDEHPCGEDLEYDADFMALETASRGREEQQFGNTIIPAEEPDWQSVIQLSMALLERSKDLRVVLMLLRGLAKTEGVTGFITGLELLVALLNQYWPHLHPMLDIEDNNDSTMRMNALMPLSDPTLLPCDLRGACLTATGIAATLTLRDLELAYDKATPHEEEDVRPKGEVLAIIAEWANKFPDDFAIAQHGLDALKSLNAALGNELGAAALPDFTGVQALLYLLGQACSQALGNTPEPVSDITDARIAPGESAANKSTITSAGELRSRQDALRLLDQVSDFLLRTEPGNPAPLLIERAKRLIGVSFLDIIAELAPDALDSVRHTTGKYPDA